MSRALGWLRMEPETEKPPVRVWRDWVLAAAVVGTTVLEVLARDDPGLRPVALALGVGLALTMLWRRTHPLAMVALAFGSLAALDLASFLATEQPFSLYAGASVLVLVYSLFRWGSTRQAAIGLLIVLGEVVVIAATDFTSLTDFAGGLLVLLSPAALGVSIRYRHLVQAQRFEQVRSQEREMLARELHDTVAHHVCHRHPGSGRAVPRRFRQSRRSRRRVGGHRNGGVQHSGRDALRGGIAAPRGSSRRVRAHSARRARYRGTRDRRRSARHTDRGGATRDLGDLGPPVQTALFRVAQESITNAQRHARQATRVHVVISGEDRAVQMCVSDDGEHASAVSRPAGYGLVGMAERLTLLGGSVRAGPAPGRGWIVTATIPRHGRAS